MRLWLLPAWWLAAGLALADVPLDLRSPFFKTVLYQKKIGGYEAGPVERKEVRSGEIKNRIFEFQKDDGTLFLISEAEVLAVLPVFPSSQTPCEKADVADALALLERSKASFPGQEEVAEATMEKWRGLLQALEESEKRWVVSSDQLPPQLRSFLLFWTLGWPGLVAVLLFACWWCFRRSRIGLAQGLLLLGLLGGGIFWLSLQPSAEAAALPGSNRSDLGKKILWTISCAQKKGLLQEKVDFRIPADEWMNFLFGRLRFQAGPASFFRPQLGSPFFRQTPGGLVVLQPVLVGPLVLPLRFELSPLDDQKSPDQMMIQKVQVGGVPLPQFLAQTWPSQCFEPYRFLWTELNQGGLVQWAVGPPRDLVIQIRPTQP
jgi:hypothetical protein